MYNYRCLSNNLSFAYFIRRIVNHNKLMMLDIIENRYIEINIVGKFYTYCICCTVIFNIYIRVIEYLPTIIIPSTYLPI